ncbi:helix-turn-helix domain-containing protein [Streptomyces olivaceoviridis]|uniref:helix-turn-helix domain-containing protein n=1 Tax=Streptomyces olivaceoviridis TaxID=1921 RepID=UPI0036AA37E9
MELDVVGLGDEAQRVYTALIGLPHSTASEVASACGTSTSAAGRLLSGLVKAGLATRSTGRPPRFTATAPDVAVTELIKERERQLDTARALVRQLTDRHREALRIADPDIAVEVLRGRDDISAAVHRITAGARRQIRTFDRPPYVDRPGSNLDDQRRRQRSGVTHRVLYDQGAVAWPGRLRDDILPSIRTGEQARVRPQLPIKLVIVDDAQAVLPFSLAPGGHLAAYLVHRSPMLTALEALFEAEWDRGSPLQAPAPTTAPPAASGHPDHLALVKLLAAGCTDAAIARAQGWSQRTTQRRIRHLMTELGATTRFQAAVQAARRGWLQEPAAFTQPTNPGEG